MKNSRPSLRVKFLIGLALYAAVIVALSFLKDYRLSLAGLFLLGAATFALSLWTWLKTTKLIALILTGCLVASPISAEDKTPVPPPPLVGIVIGCGCLIVGGIIIWGVLKCCKKLPPPPKKGSVPPDTNDFSGGAGPIASPAPPLQMPDSDLSSTASDYEVLTLAFQSSTNGSVWHTEYTTTNWLGPDRVFSVLYSNSIPLMTNQCRAYWTNENFVMNFASVMPTRETSWNKFWRAVQF